MERVKVFNYDETQKVMRKGRGTGGLMGADKGWACRRQKWEEEKALVSA